MELKISPSSFQSKQIVERKLPAPSFIVIAPARFSRDDFPSLSMVMINTCFRYATSAVVALAMRRSTIATETGAGRAMRRRATGGLKGDLFACELARRQRATVGRPRTAIGSNSLTDFRLCQ